MSMRGSSSASVMPAICAPSSTALMKQIERSCGVVGHLAMMRSPSIVSTRSVKVPPTSMSMEFIGVPSAMAVPSLRCAGVQLAVAHEQIATRQSLLQTVDVDFDVDRNRMAGRQVFRLDLLPTARTVEFQHPHPVGIGRERVFALDDRWVDLRWIAFGDQATALVVFPRGNQLAAATIAPPRVGVEIEIEIFGESDAIKSHVVLPFAPRLLRRTGGLAVPFAREPAVAEFIERHPPSGRD